MDEKKRNQAKQHANANGGVVEPHVRKANKKKLTTQILGFTNDP